MDYFSWTGFEHGRRQLYHSVDVRHLRRRWRCVPQAPPGNRPFVIQRLVSGQAVSFIICVDFAVTRRHWRGVPSTVVSLANG
jgi:hypothetical protein